jgi:hypothetical protein
MAVIVAECGSSNSGDGRRRWIAPRWWVREIFGARQGQAGVLERMS